MIEIYTLITAVASCIAAIISAAIAIYQSYSNKLHQEASVVPYIADKLNLLELDFGTATFSICNKGLGPAIVKAYDYYWDGKQIEYKALENLILENIGSRYILSLTQLGEGQEALKIQHNGNKGKFNEDDSLVIRSFLDESKSKFVIKINYKSV
ncbi:hypothetical protein [Pseudoalteromonas sp. MTN2-4]|uniref:hypothetical protein n=1 Tax=Pseudoalteromonas sp. MTN2-4 TaxID=3056555 RepID=UPI0036F20E8F